MMRVHMITRPSWGAPVSPQSPPARQRSSLSPPNLGLAWVADLAQDSDDSAHEGDDDTGSSASIPPPDFDNVADVRKYRQAAGAQKMVTASPSQTLCP